jgi:hypothetical protein
MQIKWAATVLVRDTLLVADINRVSVISVLLLCARVLLITHDWHSYELASLGPKRFISCELSRASYVQDLSRMLS